MIFYVENFLIFFENIDNANRCRTEDDLKKRNWNEHMVQRERTLYIRMDNRQKWCRWTTNNVCVCTQQLRWAMNKTKENTLKNHNVLFVRLSRSLWWLQCSGNHIYFTHPHQKPKITNAFRTYQCSSITKFSLVFRCRRFRISIERKQLI